MRRIAPWVTLLVALSCCGCQNISTPWSRSVRPIPGAHPLEAPEVRTARDAVPDSKMMPNTAHGGYVDPNGGP